MTAVIKNELGTITMNEELIASIAGFAAGENYGIVAMNSKTAGDALLQLVGGENVKRGVKVSILEDQSAPAGAGCYSYSEKETQVLWHIRKIISPRTSCSRSRGSCSRSSCMR